MACWINLSNTVGIPKFLTPPSAFGISTLFIGCVVYMFCFVSFFWFLLDVYLDILQVVTLPFHLFHLHLCFFLLIYMPCLNFLDLTFLRVICYQFSYCCYIHSFSYLLYSLPLHSSFGHSSVLVYLCDLVWWNQ